MLLPPRCCLFWSIQHNFHVCLLSFSSFWPSSLLLLSPRAWLWPGSAFQFCPLCRCGIWHAHHFCVQSHCSVHLCWGQDRCEEVGQLFSTLQLQGKTEHVAIARVTVLAMLSGKVWQTNKIPWADEVGMWHVPGSVQYLPTCSLLIHGKQAADYPSAKME